MDETKEIPGVDRSRLETVGNSIIYSHYAFGPILLLAWICFWVSDFGPRGQIEDVLAIVLNNLFVCLIAFLALLYVSILISSVIVYFLLKKKRIEGDRAHILKAKLVATILLYIPWVSTLLMTPFVYLYYVLVVTAISGDYDVIFNIMGSSMRPILDVAYGAHYFVTTLFIFIFGRVAKPRKKPNVTEKSGETWMSAVGDD